MEEALARSLGNRFGVFAYGQKGRLVGCSDPRIARGTIIKASLLKGTVLIRPEDSNTVLRVRGNAVIEPTMPQVA